MSARRLSLHPSTLIDAEHTLFTASLADLADVDSSPTPNVNSNASKNWERISVRVSVREARAWRCGRYASLGTGTTDEVIFLSCFLFVIASLHGNDILRLFPGVSTLGGVFLALRRLVLHRQAERLIDHSLAFVEGSLAVILCGLRRCVLILLSSVSMFLSLPA
jgi:hypothetical protein